MRYLDIGFNEIKKIPINILELINLNILNVSENILKFNFYNVLYGLNLELYINEPLILKNPKNFDYKLKFLIKKELLLLNKIFKNYKIIYKLILFTR